MTLSPIVRTMLRAAPPQRVADVALWLLVASSIVDEKRGEHVLSLAQLVEEAAARVAAIRKPAQ